MPEAVSTHATLTPPPARVWFTVGPVALTTGRLMVGGILALVLMAAVAGWRRLDPQALHQWAEGLPGWGVAAAIATAPLLGVPVAMFHVVAGMRFGIGAGLVVVAGCTVLHHLVGYSVVRLAPRVAARHLAAWRARFPRGAHGAMTVFSCLMPGMPYAIQLYLLPVLGVPLRTLLTLSVPLHTTRAIVSIVGGDMSDELTPAKLAMLVLYYVVLTGICMLAFRRIRKELRRPPSAATPAAGGPA